MQGTAHHGQSPNPNESSYSTSMRNTCREFYQTFALYLRAEATHLEEYILGKSKNKIQNRKNTLSYTHSNEGFGCIKSSEMHYKCLQIVRLKITLLITIPWDKPPLIACESSFFWLYTFKSIMAWAEKTAH